MLAAQRPGSSRAGGNAPWQVLMAHVRPHITALVGGSVLGLLGSAAGLVQPLVAKTVIDALGLQRSVWEPLLVLTGVILAGAGASAAGIYVLERTAANVVLTARVQLL